MTATTQTDGTAAANAVVSPASLTVFASNKGPAYLRAFFTQGNDVVYSSITNTSAVFLNNPLKHGPHKSTDTDGIPYVRVPNIPLEPNSTFAITILSVAG